MSARHKLSQGTLGSKFGTVWLKRVDGKDENGDHLFYYWILDCEKHSGLGWCDCLADVVKEDKGAQFIQENAALDRVRISVPVFPRLRLFSLADFEGDGRFINVSFITKNEPMDLATLTPGEGLRAVRNMILAFYESLMKAGLIEVRCRATSHGPSAQHRLASHVNIFANSAERHTRLAEHIALYELGKCLTCYNKSEANAEATYDDLLPNV